MALRALSRRFSSASLYTTHVPTSSLQKCLLTVGSAVGALIDPTRDDLVANLGETTGHFALQRMRDRMAADPVGRDILRERPRVNSTTIHIEELARAPAHTFGAAYYSFLQEHGISADTRKTVRFVDDEELAYVAQRYREIHDFVHTLLGLPITVHSEIVVKWFELLQTGLPMCALSALVGPVRLSFSEQRELLTTYIPWALRCAPRAAFLMNVYFEKHMLEDLDVLRATLHIEPPPAPASSSPVFTA